jgi:hypothetical protein
LALRVRPTTVAKVRRGRRTTGVALAVWALLLAALASLILLTGL